MIATNEAFYGQMLFHMSQMLRLMQAPPTAAPLAMVEQQVVRAIRDGDRGLEACFTKPTLVQPSEPVESRLITKTVLDAVFATGTEIGVPAGRTMVLSGAPGTGKTRTGLAALSSVAAMGTPSLLVTSEEGFRSATATAALGRDDLCSRLVKIAASTTGLTESDLRRHVLDNILVLERLHHRGHSWDDTCNHYRRAVEHHGVQFVVIDSLNMIDPARHRTADQLASLTQYNRQHGVTCLCIGQIRDNGLPAGGERIPHLCDGIALLEPAAIRDLLHAESGSGVSDDVAESSDESTTERRPTQVIVTVRGFSLDESRRPPLKIERSPLGVLMPSNSA